MGNLTKSNIRLATLSEIRETTVSAYLSPPPSLETIRDWCDKARVPRFKANPLAKRGGGAVYYSVAAVEKFLRNRTMLKPMGACV